MWELGSLPRLVTPRRMLRWETELSVVNSALISTAAKHPSHTSPDVDSPAQAQKHSQQKQNKQVGLYQPKEKASAQRKR